MRENVLGKSRLPIVNGPSAIGAGYAAKPSHALLQDFAPLRPVHNCRGILCHQAPDVFELWHRWESECGRERGVPYWAVVWPGAAVLARYLLENPLIIRGKVVLDLGCGGGVAGIASSIAGACAVISNDIDEAALFVASQNAAANGAAMECNNCNLVAAKQVGDLDVILVADMFYQKDQSEELLRFLLEMRQRGSTVLIADGHRPFAPRSGIELLYQEWVPVNLELEGVSEREVRLFSLL